MKIEGDIVEEFARHTLALVDHLIFVDNGSLDAAREILDELVAEGLPVRVWDGEGVPSSVPGWTALARRAFATFRTDYLLMLDVDEFVKVPSRSTLEDALGALGEVHALVPMVTYVPTPDDDPNEGRMLARVRHRLRREARSFSKVFIHRAFMEHPGASIMAGNHGVFDPDGSAISSVLPGVELAHFPVRSLRQIQSKALLGWPAFLAMGFSAEQDIAYQWRRLNDRLLEDPHWDTSEFYRSAWHYLDENDEQPDFVLDPLPSVELRYRRDPPELLPLAVAYTRQLASAFADRGRQVERNAPSAAAMSDAGGHHDLEVADSGFIVPPSYNAYERSPQRISFFATIADEINRVFRPHTVLDLGCGVGLLVESFWDRGVRAQGIDASRRAIEKVRPDMRSRCRAADFTDPIDGTFDLVICVEVLQHLDTADAEIVVANLCTITDTMLFSSTPTQSAEPTHISVCPPIVWIELFAQHGFGPDLLADATFVTPHTMVFRRGNACDVASLKTYALIVRNRTIAGERLEMLRIERRNALLAKEAQSNAESQTLREGQLRAEAQAVLEATRADTQAATEAARAQAQATAEAARAQAQAAVKAARAEAQAAADVQHHTQAAAAEAASRHADVQASLGAQLQAVSAANAELRQRVDALERLRTEALANLTRESSRYEKHVTDLQAQFADMQSSHSWRLTRPIRIAGIYAQKILRGTDPRKDQCSDK